MARVAEPVRRIRKALAGLLCGLGLLLAVVTATPVCQWWATALSAGWNEPRGDVLLVMAGSLLGERTLGVSSYWRSVYSVRAWNAGRFRRVVVTGDVQTCGAMRDFIVWSGVPPQAIEMETNSRNTRDSAVHVAAMLRGETGRIVLLTSDYHMYRSWHALRKAGVQTISAPFPDVRKRVNRPAERWGLFWELVRETAGIAYYAAKGWI